MWFLLWKLFVFVSVCVEFDAVAEGVDEFEEFGVHVFFVPVSECLVEQCAGEFVAWVGHLYAVHGDDVDDGVVYEFDSSWPTVGGASDGYGGAVVGDGEEGPEFGGVHGVSLLETRGLECYKCRRTLSERSVSVVGFYGVLRLSSLGTHSLSKLSAEMSQQLDVSSERRETASPARSMA